MITVFTPTYNRASLIPRLYNSLLEQTSKNFEWIVVDDGSTDNTEQIFKDILANENPFEIKYIKQDNGGKHRAINQGVKFASGNMFFIVDSDDYLLNNAIEKILSWEKTLDDSKKWAGVSGLRGVNRKTPIGKQLQHAFIDAKNNERQKYNMNEDKAEVYYTHILKEFPFPEFEGENFISEEVVWNKIAVEGYYLRWFNEIIYICEYLQGGLTQSGDLKYINNPKGVLCWLKVQFEAYGNDFKKKASAVYRYYEAVKRYKEIKIIANEIGISKARLLLYVNVVSIGRKIKKLIG